MKNFNNKSKTQNTQAVLRAQNSQLDSLNTAIKKYKADNNIQDKPEDKNDENIKYKKEKNNDIKILSGKIKATLKSYESTKIKNDTLVELKNDKT